MKENFWIQNLKNNGSLAYWDIIVLLWAHPKSVSDFIEASNIVYAPTDKVWREQEY